MGGKLQVSEIYGDQLEQTQKRLDDDSERIDWLDQVIRSLRLEREALQERTPVLREEVDRLTVLTRANVLKEIGVSLEQLHSFAETIPGISLLPTRYSDDDLARDGGPRVVFSMRLERRLEDVELFYDPEKHHLTFKLKESEDGGTPFSNATMFISDRLKTAEVLECKPGFVCWENVNPNELLQ